MNIAYFLLIWFIMALELSELTLEEALRSYSSVKGHRTRVEREIGNLLRLLKDQYSATSEERLNVRLEKFEKHTHRLKMTTCSRRAHILIL